MRNGALHAVHPRVEHMARSGGSLVGEINPGELIYFQKVEAAIVGQDIVDTGYLQAEQITSADRMLDNRVARDPSGDVGPSLILDPGVRIIEPNPERGVSYQEDANGYSVKERFDCGDALPFRDVRFGVAQVLALPAMRLAGLENERERESWLRT